jgi:pyruvate formate lyase activating enzyme
MRISGLVETSLVDWDGKIVSVLFVAGCDFRCPFCHNHLLAADGPDLDALPWPRIRETLTRKRGWVDGVVVTGGEPMMHPEVFELCAKVRELGLLVKLDTNGTFPYPLQSLIARGLVDFVAMDIKSPLTNRYSSAAGRPVDLRPIRRSIRLLLESGVDHEFRSTLVRGLIEPEDMAAIGQAVAGARRLVLQQFNPADAPAEAYRQKKPYSLAEAEAMAEATRPFVKDVRLRGKFL